MDLVVEGDRGVIEVAHRGCGTVEVAGEHEVDSVTEIGRSVYPYESDD